MNILKKNGINSLKEFAEHMLFGFELEILDDPGSYLQDYVSSYHEGEWEFNESYRIEEDGSLSRGGMEIISRKHVIGELDELYEIFMENIYPESSNFWTNHTCGLHLSFSCDFFRLQDLCLYSYLTTLRKRAIQKVNRKLFTYHYFRSYAKELKGYHMYRKDRYLEFNIRDRYIEWRSMNYYHLKKYTGKDLINKVFKHIKEMEWLVIKTTYDFLMKPEEVNEIKSYENTPLSEWILINNVLSLRKKKKLKDLLSYEIEMKKRKPYEKTAAVWFLVKNKEKSIKKELEIYKLKVNL